MIQPRVADSLMGGQAQADTREVGQQRPGRSGEGPCDKGAAHGAGRAGERSC